MTETNGNGNKLKTAVTWVNLIWTFLAAAMAVGGAFFANWISTHDRILNLELSVKQNSITQEYIIKTDNRLTNLEFYAKQSVEDRIAMHKSFDAFSLVVQDNRDRLIRLEYQQKGMK